MALVIEDGTGIQGANSFVTVQEFKDYANARGMLIPTTEPELEALLVRGWDYIQFNPNSYCGTQIFPWTVFPRSGLTINGFVVGDSDIPYQLKLAQMQLGVEGTLYDEFRPNRSGGAITKEKVDVLEVDYAKSTDGSAFGLYLTAVEDLLSLFYCNGLGGLPLRTKRA